jgi:L-threonylcarbamoyladenylate synthase
MEVRDVTDPSRLELASKDAAITLLKDGAIVYPTDTIYGLGVNALNEYAVERLFKIKKRPDDKPVPVLVSSLSMAKAIAFVDRDREKLLAEFWPGPYTFVLWKKKIVPRRLTGGKETVAVRVPAHALCQSILREFEAPITATSANISGEVPVSSALSIAQRFVQEDDRPDLILDAGILSELTPSTIIDLTHEPPKVLRVNPTTKDKLLAILKNVE